MEAPEDQELAVRKDLDNLTRSLKSDNLNPDIMFARARGIRSCTPKLGTTSKSSVSVSEQLRRVRVPAE
ncbi:MAG: hypothetical protein GYA23_01460 [Methanomicrobiales archaeon]|nr:hypothetical protein [Methanomicrobiales archaeon]